MLRRGSRALAALLSLAGALSVRAETLLDTLTVIAPATAGGGWDQTARAIEQALRESGLVSRVEVVNSPGAGGTIGLAQFVGERKGFGGALLVGGQTMVRAIRANSAVVSLGQTTPIARLTGEYEVVAVSAGSELATLDDLVQALRVNPGAVAWGGGSGGGTDQALISELARAIGVEPVHMSYVPFAGGGEVASALLDHQVAVAVSGYAELADHVASGRIRPLAISSERRVPGIAIPTFKEQGIDLTLVNWRGVFAPPAISTAARAALEDLIARMVRTDAWKASLSRHRWSDLYLPGGAFSSFVAAEERLAKSGPDPRGTVSTARPGAIWTRGMWILRNRNLLAAAIAVAVLLGAALIAWQRRSGARRERDLSHRLEIAQEHAQRKSAETADLLRGLSDQIERQFAAWQLTGAEREVALLMLKGLRHKEIASLRGTSERTVRQQALTIYKKAGLDGRTDLAAFFLEDLLQPVASAAQRRPA